MLISCNSRCLIDVPTRSGVGGGGSEGGGALAYSLGFSVEISGNFILFGQFHITWAILHQNLWQFHIFWASLRQNFGQFNIYQTVSISVETFFFGGHLNSNRKTTSISVKTFFLEVTLIGTEKPIAFLAKLIQCHFSGKSLVSPQILLSSYAHAYSNRPNL